MVFFERLSLRLMGQPLTRVLSSEGAAYIQKVYAGWPGRSGAFLRASYWRKRIGGEFGSAQIGTGFVVGGEGRISIGERFVCASNCFLYASGQGSIAIEDDVFLNNNVTLDSGGGGKIHIGKESSIGMNSVIRSANHNFDDPKVPIVLQGSTPGEIYIGRDVWIGASAILLPGAKLGDGCVVAAGSVVSRNFPDLTVIAGNPARSVGRRGEG